MECKKKKPIVTYCDNSKGFGLHFNPGIDPQILIDAIREIDACGIFIGRVCTISKSLTEIRKKK